MSSIPMQRRSKRRNFFGAGLAGMGMGGKLPYIITPSTIDTFTAVSAPDFAFGSQVYFEVSGTRIGLIKFDLTGISPTKTIRVARLLISPQATITDGFNSYSFHRVKAANANWDENSTWNYRVPSTERWAGDAAADGGADAGCSVAGTDFENTNMGTIYFYQNDAPGSYRGRDLAVGEVASLRAANYGMAFRITGGTSCYLSTREATYKPILAIYYA